MRTLEKLYLCPIQWIGHKYNYKLWSVKKDTNLNQFFLLIKSSKIIFIFSPAFYLIKWLMASPKNFEKIPILKTWQMVFFWGIKTYFGILPLKWCIFRQYFIDKLSLFFTKVSFDTSEGKQFSYFHNNHFFKILW